MWSGAGDPDDAVAQGRERGITRAVALGRLPIRVVRVAVQLDHDAGRLPQAVDDQRADPGFDGDIALWFRQAVAPAELGETDLELAPRNAGAGREAREEAAQLRLATAAAIAMNQVGQGRRVPEPPLLRDRQGLCKPFVRRDRGQVQESPRDRGHRDPVGDGALVIGDLAPMASDRVIAAPLRGGGHLHEAPRRIEIPQHRRRSVAGDRLIATRHHTRQHPAALRQAASPRRVHTPVHQPQAPAPRRRSMAGSLKPAARNCSRETTPCCRSASSAITSSCRRAYVHVDYRRKRHARRAWRQAGATVRARGARDVAGVWRDDRCGATPAAPRRTGRVMSWLMNGFWAYPARRRARSPGSASGSPRTGSAARAGRARRRGRSGGRRRRTPGARVALDVEAVGILVARLVAVRRHVPHHHLLALADRACR